LADLHECSVLLMVGAVNSRPRRGLPREARESVWRTFILACPRYLIPWLEGPRILALWLGGVAVCSRGDGR
jgi:hypothetical protein